MKSYTEEQLRAKSMVKLLIVGVLALVLAGVGLAFGGQPPVEECEACPQVCPDECPSCICKPAPSVTVPRCSRDQIKFYQAQALAEPGVCDAAVDAALADQGPTQTTIIDVDVDDTPKHEMWDLSIGAGADTYSAGVGIYPLYRRPVWWKPELVELVALHRDFDNRSICLDSYGKFGGGSGDDDDDDNGGSSRNCDYRVDIPKPDENTFEFRIHSRF